MNDLILTTEFFIKQNIRALARLQTLIELGQREKAREELQRLNMGMIKLKTLNTMKAKDIEEVIME